MYRVLIIGCGNIAGRFDETRPDGAPPLTHAGAYRRNGHFEIVGCVDPDAKRRRAFTRHWGVPWDGPSIEDWPGDDVAVVSICSPTANHVEHLSAALALHPKLIFCEKPVTLSSTETALWVRRCEEAGTALAVNHTRRWAPDVVALKQEIELGRWGELRGVIGTYSKGILNNGSHLLDLIDFLLGKALELAAVGPPRWDHWPGDPTVPATLVTKDGLTVHLATADARDYARFELELAFSGGVITMEEGGFAWRTRRALDSLHFEGYRTLTEGEFLPGRYLEAMTLAASNLRQALTSDVPLASTGQSALRAQRLCAAIKTASLAEQRTSQL